MESASSAKSRLPARQCAVSGCWTRFKVVAAGALVVSVAIRFLPRFVLQSWALFLVFVLLTMWTFHLGRASLPAFWSYLLSALLVAELLLTLSGGHELPGATLLATAWSSLLLHLLLYTVGAAIVTQELRAVASAAVVFGVAVHGRAVVMVAGMFLCVVLWFKCSPWYGGAVKSGLLIFTPAAVGVLTISVMKTMAPDLYHSALAMLAALSPDRLVGAEAISGGLQTILPASLFAAGAVVSRIVERRAGYGDLAYLALLLYLLAGLSLGKGAGDDDGSGRGHDSVRGGDEPADAGATAANRIAGISGGGAVRVSVGAMQESRVA